jgi:hypothetical protein
MTMRPISDELLRVTIESRIEDGVDEGDIRDLIGKFASEQSPNDPNDRLIGFLWVEDIPADDRQEFLAALVALPVSARRNVKLARHASRWQKQAAMHSLLGLWQGAVGAFGAIRKASQAPSRP